MLGCLIGRPVSAQEPVPPFDELLAHRIALKPELVGVHPRVFVTKAGLVTLRDRARTSHRAEWSKVLANLAALKSAPPPVPGPQERRSQNNVAFAIAEASLAYTVERKPEYLSAARAWTLAAIDYEPWGYTYNKPNTDLAAGHLLYAIGWAYDCCTTTSRRRSARASAPRSNGTPDWSTTSSRQSPGGSMPSPRITTSFRPPASRSPRSRSWASRRMPSAGRRLRAPTIIAPANCWVATATTTKDSNTGSSPARGSCISSTRGSMRRARASGTAICFATGRRTSRTRFSPTARASSTSATSGKGR